MGNASRPLPPFDIPLQIAADRQSVHIEPAPVSEPKHADRPTHKPADSGIDLVGAAIGGALIYGAIDSVWGDGS